MSQEVFMAFLTHLPLLGKGFTTRGITEHLLHLESTFWCYLEAIQTSCSFKAAKNLAFSVMFFSLFLS